MKKLVVLVFVMGVLFSCGEIKEGEVTQSAKTRVVAENEKIQVTTSIVPLASIANYIGGEKVEVNNLVSVGVSPHGFGLTTQNMINIQKSDVVFLLGIQDIDGFLFKSLSGVKSIALDSGLKVLDATSEHDHSDHEEEEDHEDEHEEEDHNEEKKGEAIDEDSAHLNKYLAKEGEGHVHAEASIDPHVWNGKVNSLLIAKKIQTELSTLQPSHKALFQENYESFEVKVTEAFVNFALKTTGKKQKEFIVFHDAYNYLLFDAGIDMEKKIIFRSNVMSQPGSADMKKLTDEVTLHGIIDFFVEPQFESKALTILAEENNAQIYKLDPLGSSAGGEGFLNTLNSNLDALSNIYE